MKVIHVPFCFPPDPVGGTEIYVAALAREQSTRGVQVLVAAPASDTAAYAVDGLPVRRFAVSQTRLDLRALYGEGDVTASQEFAKLLDTERPDLVHLHAFTSGISVRLARQARRRGMRLVFTYHTPTVSCARGTLLQWGREVCTGRLDRATCARCTLHGLGAGRPGSAVLGGLPPRVGAMLGELGLSGGPWTALRMSELIELRHAALRTLLQEVDCVVVLCQWSQDLLRLIGIDPDRLVLSRHGLATAPAASPHPTAGRPQATGPLRVAFFGRFHHTKGPDLLIRALRALPRLPVDLHLYGVSQARPADAYQRELEVLAAGDPRIAFFPPVAHDQVVERLQGYHVLAVPSRWLETGPLVVLEAFAAGVPVVGSRLGGINELVQDEVNGLLVEPNSLAEWQRALSRLAEDRHLVARLKRGTRPPRSMGEVAEEMLTVYANLLRRSPLRLAPAAGLNQAAHAIP
jgi:glycosyltransferase involved in cell wall biosynthesis